MSVTSLSTGTFPNDLLCNVLQQAKPNLKKLIIWSLVNHQFRYCSLDVSLWRPLAYKHAIMDCTRGEQVQEALIARARQAFHRNPPWYECWHKVPTPLFCHNVHSQYTNGTPPLLEENPSRFANTSGKSFPITYDGKTYSIKTENLSFCEPRYSLEIQGSGSTTKIPLPNVSVPYPKGELNDDVLILEEKKGESLFLKLLYLNSDHSQTQTICSEYIAPIEIEPYFFDSACQNTIKWKLFKGGFVSTTYRRFPSFKKCDEVRYVNYALRPLTKAMDALKKIDQNLICLLRGCILNTDEMPDRFLCRFSKMIMSNPVRDKCAETEHVFEKEAIMQFLSKTAVLEARCPVSNQIMPILTKECLVLDTGETEPDFTVNAYNGLTGDADLQGEILAWLQKQVGPNKEREIAALKGNCMEDFMQTFSEIPCSYKAEVYGHLCAIQKPVNSYEGIGEDIFYGRNEQSSTKEEKMEALRRCIHAEEINALEWMF